MNVIISPNIKKERVRINPNGDIIDKNTKQIVEKNTPDYMPTIEEIKANMAKQEEPKLEPTKQVPAMSIQQQIEETKANLAKLQELKKLKIAEMEAQLELLKEE